MPYQETYIEETYIDSIHTQLITARGKLCKALKNSGGEESSEVVSAREEVKRLEGDIEHNEGYTQGSANYSSFPTVEVEGSKFNSIPWYNPQRYWGRKKQTESAPLLATPSVQDSLLPAPASTSIPPSRWSRLTDTRAKKIAWIVGGGVALGGTAVLLGVCFGTDACRSHHQAEPVNNSTTTPFNATTLTTTASLNDSTTVLMSTTVLSTTAATGSFNTSTTAAISTTDALSTASTSIPNASTSTTTITTAIPTTTITFTIPTTTTMQPTTTLPTTTTPMTTTTATTTTLPHLAQNTMSALGIKSGSGNVNITLFPPSKTLNAFKKVELEFPPYQAVYHWLASWVRGRKIGFIDPKLSPFERQFPLTAEQFEILSTVNFNAMQAGYNAHQFAQVLRDIVKINGLPAKAERIIFEPLVPFIGTKAWDIDTRNGLRKGHHGDFLNYVAHLVERGYLFFQQR